MRIEKLSKIQKNLELITQKWWFFLLFFLLFFIPSYSSKRLDPRESSQLVIDILSNALIYSYPILMPVFKIVPILLIMGIVWLGNKFTRLFNVYVTFTAVLFTFFQTTAITEKYGLAILLGNLAVYLVVAIFWIWETIVKENDFTPEKRPLWKYWVVPLAFLAFWYPINLKTLKPDFNLLYILTSESGMTYCMMTPVYLGILTLYYPKINRATLRVTSFAGLITGLLSVVQFFILHSYTWWMGVLHLPLLFISFYAFLLSLRKEELLKIKM